MKPAAPAQDLRPSAAFVTFTLVGQLCGVPVTAVRDVLRGQPITRIPLAPRDIAGSLNLRGRIVTAIDVRKRLLLPAAEAGTVAMSVVTELDGELYALQVDQALDVVTPDEGAFEANPQTLPSSWSRYCAGVYRLPKALLLVLDLPALLSFAPNEA